MRLLLHIADSSTETTAALRNGELVPDREAVRAATGWEVEDYGLCRGDLCHPASLGETLTLSELATALGRPLAVEIDEDQSIAVLGEPGGTTIQRGELVPDLHGST